MIENKLIKIKKENTFDFGWALFAPCKDISFRNNAYDFVSVDNIIKKITYAQSMILMLSEPCLSRKVIDELMWVNKYAEINIIAKSEKLIEYYKEIHFNTVKIEPLLTLNYLGIKEKDGKSCYFIENGYINTDDAVEKLYTATQSENIDLSVVKSATKVIIIGDSYLLYREQIIAFCLKNKIGLYLAKNIADFRKSDYDNYFNSDIMLIVADNIGEGICIVKENRLFILTLVNGHFILIEIESLKKFISGDFFINLKKQPVLAGDEIPSNVYLLSDGKLDLLKQADCYVVEKEVPITTMKEFIEEKFDSSETENHNQYSAMAKNVEYHFTLLPPAYTEEFIYSALYNPVLDLFKKWCENSTLPIDSIMEEIELFQGKELFTVMLKNIEDTNESIKFIVDGYEYKSYRDIINKCKNNLIYDGDNIIDYCLALNNMISAEISDTQNSKIDAEIAGYERTIREKQADIEQNIDVLKNKHRIEILKRKIEDLLKIKRDFSLKQEATAADSKSEFVSWCNKILDENLPKVEENSVSSIVNSKEMSKREQLHIFLQKWLKPIKTTLAKLIDILSLIENVDVPEDYVVYDYEDSRYIVIDDIEEYHKTMPLQKKYNLQCVARRYL